MKFSDDLLKSVSAILEAKPRVSFDGDKATVHSKNGTPMKSFNKKDLGNSYRKHADNFLSQNYKKLNAESVIVEELEEAKQLELPGMEKKKPQQLELPFGKKDDKKKPVKESEDQLDEISKGTMGSYVKKASDDVANRAYHSGGDRHDNEFNSSEKTPERKKLLNRRKGIKTAVKRLTKESEDVNASNAAKATMHDCANHVRHEQYGLGQTISTMHTLEEDEDGNGYVTHYDVMFQGEDGPFIMEDVWVEDLEIISEKHHGHPKGKKKMSEDVEAIDEKKGHKKDKGDMDGDGVDEPDDKEYMDNKDKAIKMAMSKKKSESPIKKVEEEAELEEAPTYVPGFMGADGKPTSKPTKKDYDSNKEYQSMKKKLGDRIPGPPPVKKINKEHLDSISAALQEISKKTLGSYVKKASSDAVMKASDATKQYHKDEDDEKAFNLMDKADKRLKGVKKASDKLAKESIDSEHLDEISTKTMRSYVGKAKDDMAHHQNIQRAADKGSVPKSDPAVQFHKKEEKKRKVGIQLAAKKLAKESNEYTDDLADRIRSHENKKERKKAEKAFTAGDYEKATGHIGGTYRDK